MASSRGRSRTCPFRDAVRPGERGTGRRTACVMVVVAALSCLACPRGAVTPAPNGGEPSDGGSEAATAAPPANADTGATADQREDVVAAPDAALAADAPTPPLETVEPP